MITEFEAILSLMPEAKITYEEGSVRWHDLTQVPPSEADIASELTRLRNEYEANKYKDKRRNEYPPQEDFLDAWVKNDEQALEAYRQKCLAVKIKYPK